MIFKKIEKWGISLGRENKGVCFNLYKKERPENLSSGLSIYFYSYLF